MAFTEILFAIALLIPLIPMALARQWWLFRVFAFFYVVFGLTEWWAVSTTGRSVSQHFWYFSEDNQGMAWGILGTMGIMWVGLLWHLGVRLLRRK